jgi:capsular polysaccharide biosynthesis protein
MPWIRVEPCQIKMTLADGVSDLSQDKLRKLLRRARLQRFRKAVEVEGILYDTRFDTSHNYAHVMINLIGRLLLAKSEGVVKDLWEVCVIVPEDVPAYAREAWEIAGVRVEATNLPVAGRHLTVSNSSNVALMLRAEWPRHFASRIAPVANAPKKLYLSRRGRRSVTNESHIRELLESYG